MIRLAFLPALFLVPLPTFLAVCQSRNVPKETLPPILTPWELTPTVGDNDAFPAYKVFGNVYYVGTQDYASFLVTSSEGPCEAYGTGVLLQAGLGDQAIGRVGCSSAPSRSPLQGAGGLRGSDVI
jgi:hypothetical protein